MMDKKYNPKAIAKTIDVEELYDLDVTIARFILPRLMVFKKHCERTPRLNMTPEEWNKVLDKMIYAFERIACQTEEDTPEYKAYIKAIWNNEEDLVDLKRAAKASLKPITEGLSLYHKYYRSDEADDFDTVDDIDFVSCNLEGAGEYSVVGFRLSGGRRRHGAYWLTR